MGVQGYKRQHGGCDQGAGGQPHGGQRAEVAEAVDAGRGEQRHAGGGRGQLLRRQPQRAGRGHDQHQVLPHHQQRDARPAKALCQGRRRRDAAAPPPARRAPQLGKGFVSAGWQMFKRLADELPAAERGCGGRCEREQREPAPEADGVGHGEQAYSAVEVEEGGDGLPGAAAVRRGGGGVAALLLRLPASSRRVWDCCGRLWTAAEERRPPRPQDNRMHVFSSLLQLDCCRRHARQERVGEVVGVHWLEKSAALPST